MNEGRLRHLIGQVRSGKVSRRAFLRRMAAAGLAAPLANQLLAYSGVAMAQSKPTYKPTKRGGGGLLKVLWWQAPTLLNPHFAVGNKDQDGSSLFYEPRPAGMPMATCGRSWPSPSPAARTARLPPTASR
jgi:peptide/nickel transport system substrate-binding protein